MLMLPTHLLPHPLFTLSCKCFDGGAIDGDDADCKTTKTKNDLKIEI
jgi:hypothetical protein